MCIRAVHSNNPDDFSFSSPPVIYENIFNQATNQNHLNKLLNDNHGTPVGLGNYILANVASGEFDTNNGKAVNIFLDLTQEVFTISGLNRHENLAQKDIDAFMETNPDSFDNIDAFLSHLATERGLQLRALPPLPNDDESISVVLSVSDFFEQENETFSLGIATEEHVRITNGLFNYFCGEQGVERTTWQKMNAVMGFQGGEGLCGSELGDKILGVFLDIFCVATAGLGYALLTAGCYLYDRYVIDVELV